ncbi:hypothetical protein [Pseudomonas sp. LP_7_YM]|uniref:hypothetical protein n=1 Tax=Pseudomonas sp. LP_7_YM TaxID=2485137 RepID=UPI00105B6640|nr:hypothetical protein [Pseudomonas sp. LP_7_YM]TDV70089.1 hypothetical protein EC915_102354 [Pseudomonas sp. LP_7_YM]
MTRQDRAPLRIRDTQGRDEKRLDAFSTIKTISESPVMPSLHIPATVPSESRPVLSTLRPAAQCIVTSRFPEME